MKGDVQLLLFPASFIILSFHGALSVVPMVTFCAHPVVRGGGILEQEVERLSPCSQRTRQKSMKDGLTLN